MTESTDVASSPAERRGRRRAKRPRNADPTASTRVEILKSAAKAFRKLGYHGATVEEIASALHMKKGNLYYYFRNKEEILFACHQYSLDRLTHLFDEVQKTMASPDDKLRRLIIAFVHTILDELHGTALFLDLEGGDRPPRPVRTRRSRNRPRGDRSRHVPAWRSEAVGVRAVWRGQLDPA